VHIAAIASTGITSIANLKVERIRVRAVRWW